MYQIKGNHLSIPFIIEEDNVSKYHLDSASDSTSNEINKKETDENSLILIENSNSIPILLTIKLYNAKKFQDNKNSIIEGIDKATILVNK